MSNNYKTKKKFKYDTGSPPDIETNEKKKKRKKQTYILMRHQHLITTYSLTLVQSTNWYRK